MATLSDPKPSRQSRKIVALLRDVGVEAYDPDKAAIIRLGRLRKDSTVLRDDPERWYLHQDGVFLSVTGWDTVSDVLKFGADFSFWWGNGLSASVYYKDVRMIDVWACRPAE